MSRIISLTLTAISLLACSQSDEAVPTSFRDCWNFQSASESRYEIDFQAVSYPRGGIIAYNDKCPKLRLAMNFSNAKIQPGFDLFEETSRHRLDPIGFRGTARIRIEGQLAPTTLKVTVEQLANGELLKPSETDRLRIQMEH